MDILVPNQFYSTLEIAQLLKLQPRTVQRWIEAGQRKAYAFGRKYRIRVADFNLFLETYKIKPPAPRLTRNGARLVGGLAVSAYVPHHRNGRCSTLEHRG